MAKVKIFKFRVSNASSSVSEEDVNSAWYKKTKSLLQTEEEIESTINDFIKDKTLIDIKINTIEVNWHNNGRGNTVDLVYTIIFS